MKIISAENLVYAYGDEAEPALEVEQGEVFRLDTHDRFQPLIRGERLDERTINQVTGYVYVNGAAPGQSLKVDIIYIELKGNSGIIVAAPGLGGFKDKIAEFRTKKISFGRHLAQFREDIRVPVNPMVGRLGTFPAGDPVSSGTPGPTGVTWTITISPPASLFTFPSTGRELSWQWETSTPPRVTGSRSYPG